ncbi:hypothetical protein HPB52_013643 [Rhipicephalus sanguineus]|uniref:Dehydrogenase with different specificities related to short-chain alcohol dehydrogenase n=1 Tax=Rhipicephalus sanguineus TaxID=34632 RepID=A0A9D4QB19_RHISA|nr:hypothetical protein HPB52_013643 [Rhipicephalus sanguineus]
MVSLLKSKPVVLLSAVGTGVGAILLFREYYVGGCRYDSDKKLDGKLVVITGANTGLGKAAAKEFATRGASVVMACRDLNKCRRRPCVLNTVHLNTVRYLPCQLASHARYSEVRKCGVKQVDILVNNAGIMRCPKLLTKDGFEMQLGVNHLGHFCLTSLLLDKIKAAAPSRVINVASTAHQRGKINFTDLNSDNEYDPATAYNQSKLANVLFTKELAEKLKGTGVSVFAVHPGIVNTDITRYMGIASSWTATLFAKPLLWLFAKTPQQGVQGIMYCALSDGLEEHSGKYFW